MSDGSCWGAQLDRNQKELFNRFREIGLDIGDLGDILQNSFLKSNYTPNKDEIEDWNKAASDKILKLTQLVKDTRDYLNYYKN